MVRSTAGVAGSGGAAGGPGARSRSRASPGLRRGTCTGPGRRGGPGFQPRVRAAIASCPDPYSARPKSVMESSSSPPSGTIAARPLKSSKSIGCAADFPEISPSHSVCKPQPYPVTAPMPTMLAAPSTFTMCTSLRATPGIEQPGYPRARRPTVEQRLLPCSHPRSRSTTLRRGERPVVRHVGNDAQLPNRGRLLGRGERATSAREREPGGGPRLPRLIARPKVDIIFDIADEWAIELEPEVERWLDELPPKRFGAAAFHIDRLATLGSALRPAGLSVAGRRAVRAALRSRSTGVPLDLLLRYGTAHRVADGVPQAADERTP